MTLLRGAHIVINGLRKRVWKKHANVWEFIVWRRDGNGVSGGVPKQCQALGRACAHWWYSYSGSAQECTTNEGWHILSNWNHLFVCHSGYRIVSMQFYFNLYPVIPRVVANGISYLFEMISKIHMLCSSTSGSAQESTGKAETDGFQLMSTTCFSKCILDVCSQQVWPRELLTAQ